MVVTGRDPYTTTPAMLARLGDPVARAVQDWRGSPSVYGSLASGLQALASEAGGTSVRLTVFVLSLLNVAAFVVTGLLLHRLARGRRAAVAGRAALDRQPLLLQVLVAGAHVDSQAIMFAVAAMAVFCLGLRGPRGGRPTPGRALGPGAGAGPGRRLGRPGAPAGAAVCGRRGRRGAGRAGAAVKPTMVLVLAGLLAASVLAAVPAGRAAGLGRAAGVRRMAGVERMAGGARAGGRWPGSRSSRRWPSCPGGRGRSGQRFRRGAWSRSARRGARSGCSSASAPGRVSPTTRSRRRRSSLAAVLLVLLLNALVRAGPLPRPGNQPVPGVRPGRTPGGDTRLATAEGGTGLVTLAVAARSRSPPPG